MNQTIQPGPKLADGRTAEVFAWGDGQVLKLYRPGWNRRTVEFERRQALASQQTGYRVPQVGDIVEVEGRFGIEYERIEGRTMLDAIQQQPLRFWEFSRLMTDMHLDMHARTAQGLESAVERLAGKIRRVEAFDQKTRDVILNRLFELPQEDKLLHGDFHPLNILLTSDGPVIIDWIDATRGHPLADVARTAVIAHFAVPKEQRFSRFLFRNMARTYLKRYLRFSPYSRKELRDWMLPVAAGRIEENIAHEIEPLLKFVHQLILN